MLANLLEDNLRSRNKAAKWFSVSGFTREDADKIPIYQKSTCFFNSALNLINSEIIGQTIVQYITVSQSHLCKGFERLEEQNCRTIAKSNIKIQARA